MMAYGLLKTSIPQTSALTGGLVVPTFLRVIACFKIPQMQSIEFEPHPPSLGKISLLCTLLWDLLNISNLFISNVHGKFNKKITVLLNGQWFWMHAKPCSCSDEDMKRETGGGIEASRLAVPLDRRSLHLLAMGEGQTQASQLFSEPRERNAFPLGIQYNKYICLIEQIYKNDRFIPPHLPTWREVNGKFSRM